VYVQAFGKDEALRRAVSPLHRVAQGKGIPPFSLVVAVSREQKIEQATSFQSALRAAGVRCEFGETPEHDRGSLNRATGETGDRVTAAMAGFLGISTTAGSGGTGQTLARSATFWRYPVGEMRQVGRAGASGGDASKVASCDPWRFGG